MQNRLHAAVAAIIIGVAPTLCLAQAALTSGEVRKIDASAQKITIRHGPIKKLGMDEGMTMVFRVADPAMLMAVKAGDKVRFDAENVNGAYTLTRIEKAR